MPYAFIQDVPADENLYRQIRELLPTDTPAGLLTHIAAKRDGGLRYIDVWETEAQWIAFRDTHVEPAVGEVLASYGLPHDASVVTLQPIDVIDVWCGARR